MIPALGLIWAAIEAAPKLFDAGQAIYETITGSKSQATTPAELKAEVSALPAEQQAKFVELIDAQRKQYEAETARLVGEQGEVTADILSLLPPAVAAKIAELRMTTRPKIALQSMRVLMLPFYVVIFDGCSMILEFTVKLFGAKVPEVPRLGLLLTDGKLPYAQLYDMSAWPCATIVLGYMTLKSVFERDKGTGQPGGGGIAGTISGAIEAIGSLKTAFGKKRP